MCVQCMAVGSLEESWALIAGMEESRGSPNVAVSEANAIREDWYVYCTSLWFALLIEALA